MDMGMGHLGGQQLIFKRKFRWTFEVEGAFKVERHFVKVAARPNLTVEETEINFLHAKGWIPGKAAWETVTVNYYDVASNENQNLWNWLASVYDFTDPVALKMGTMRADYAATGTITMYDGSGTSLEQWTLKDLWPQAINFGELDYSSSEECNIEVTLRFSNVEYQSLCPNFKPQGKSTPCA